MSHLIELNLLIPSWCMKKIAPLWPLGPSSAKIDQNFYKADLNRPAQNGYD